MRRDIADKLYSLVIKRFSEEQPNRELTKSEMDGVWYAIYGRLCRGQSELDVEEWCKTVSLSEKQIHKTIRCGY